MPRGVVMEEVEGVEQEEEKLKEVSDGGEEKPWEKVTGAKEGGKQGVRA